MRKLQPDNAVDDFPTYHAYIQEGFRLVKSLGAHVSDQQALICPAPKKWSSAQLMAHLCSIEFITTYRIGTMLVENNPLMARPHANKFLEKLGWSHLPFSQHYATWVGLRAATLATLENITDKKLQRTGIVRKLGRNSHKDYTTDIALEVRSLGLHDVKHITQIKRTLVSQGPFNE